MAKKRNRPAGNPQEEDRSVSLHKIHKELCQNVAEVVDRVSHLEHKWEPNEMTRRIVRWFYKSASNENLRRQCMAECVKNFVDVAMQGYSAACQDTDWFFVIDLIPSLTAAASALLIGTRERGVSYDRIEELVEIEYEDRLDIILRSKAMYYAVHKSFNDPTVVTKVYAQVFKCYDVALGEVNGDSRPRDDVERMEQFTKNWANKSMGRCWNSVGSDVLTKSSVCKLFGNLMAPFGDDHIYSCIPNVFYQDQGRPDRTWPYIREVVNQMFDSWGLGQSAPRAKRRKTNAVRHTVVEQEGDRVFEEGGPVSGVDDEYSPARHRQFVRGPASSSVDEDADPSPGLFVDRLWPGNAPRLTGHPDCTSENDCAGTVEDALVQHLLKGVRGDIYCQTCWDQFRKQKPALECIQPL